MEVDSEPCWSSGRDSRHNIPRINHTALKQGPLYYKTECIRVEKINLFIFYIYNLYIAPLENRESMSNILLHVKTLSHVLCDLHTFSTASYSTPFYSCS